MSHYIGQYVKACDLCLWTNVQCHPLIRELVPLPIPESHWDTISIDFIVKLPESHGYDAVMNVVDSVSKMSHFIPTHITITALGAACPFLAHVWKLHGLLRQVVSNQGLQFIVEFTWELYHLLRVKLATTTAYHAQGDGQIEQVSQELEWYLQLFINKRQDDWDKLLPLAKFQYNNHVHSATQQTPFMLDTSHHLQMGFEPHQVESQLETVNKFQDRMDSTLSEARSTLMKAKEDMAWYYN